MEIKLKNVKFNDNVKNLDLNFKSDEITSIIGKNTSGKSKILDLLYGDISLIDGEIKIGKFIINKNTTKKKIKELRNNISYLKETYNSYIFNINALEDVKYGLKEINKEYLDELLNLFKIKSELLSRNYMELSRSEIKKIYLIHLLLKDSQIILLDNPNSDLDEKSVQNLIKILRKEKRKGKIIILISQDSEFVLQVSDRIIVFDNKKILLDSNKYDVMKNEKILKKVHIKTPGIIKFENRVLELKNIKLGYRDNLNDLIKDIYRNAK